MTTARTAKTAKTTTDTTAKTAPAKRTPATRTAKAAPAGTATAKATPAKASPAAKTAPTKAAPAPAAALPAYVIVERKRRFANVTTRVLDLKHPKCPVQPRAFADFGVDGPVFEWAAECVEHGEMGFFRRKDIAEANVADPWDFCSTCAHVMGDMVEVKR
ncbi:MAG: hypothetical protein ACRDQ5_03480 [Sciscionella sp.]